MNSETQLRIIVPVYNVAEYLPQCIESILNQTHRNLEIILINDGSTDNSGDICEKHAKADNRIKIIHQANAGLSAARNTGIDAATGDYIGFVDSDDWILPNMYKRLLAEAISTKSDLVICGFKYVNDNDIEIGGMIGSAVDDEILTVPDAFDRLTNKGNAAYSTAVNRLCDKKIFEKLRFPEGRIHEDEFTVHYIFDKCAKIASISDKLYMYLQRDDSITQKPYTIKRLDAWDAFYDRYNFFIERNMEIFAQKTLHFMAWSILLAYKHLNYKEYNKTIYPMYDKTFWLILKSIDPGGAKLAIKLFLYKNMKMLESLFGAKK